MGAGGVCRWHRLGCFHRLPGQDGAVAWKLRAILLAFACSLRRGPFLGRVLRGRLLAFNFGLMPVVSVACVLLCVTVVKMRAARAWPPRSGTSCDCLMHCRSYGAGFGEQKKRLKPALARPLWGPFFFPTAKALVQRRRPPPLCLPLLHLRVIPRRFRRHCMFGTLIYPCFLPLSPLRMAGEVAVVSWRWHTL